MKENKLVMAEHCFIGQTVYIFQEKTCKTPAPENIFT